LLKTWMGPNCGAEMEDSDREYDEHRLELAAVESLVRQRPVSVGDVLRRQYPRLGRLGVHLDCAPGHGPDFKPHDEAE
jgi:hypothetical protein